MVKIDKFFGGISQDDRMQSAGEYTYGQNINIRKGKWIELARKPEQLSNTFIFSGTESITSAIVASNGSTYYGTNEGRIIVSTNGGQTTGVVFVGDVVDNVLDMREMDGNLFWFLDNVMYVRANFEDGNPWVNPTNVTKVSTEASSYRQSILVGDVLLYFIDGKKIGRILASTPTTIGYYGEAFGIAFQGFSQLVGLTMHGNTVWAYEADGSMYCLDNQSEEVIGFKDFKEKIIAVKNIGGYDIVITSSITNPNSRSWFANTGVSPESTQLIRRYIYSNTVAESVSLGGYRFGFDTISDGRDSCFADSEGILYWVSNETGSPIIYSYGKNNNTLPESVSIVSSVDDEGDNWGDIEAIWVQDGAIVISQVKDNKNYLKKIQTFDERDTVYTGSGFIVTKVEDFGDYSVPKIILQVLEGADIPTGTSIQLDYSINEGEFIPYRTITNADQIGVNGKKIEFSAPIEMFNEISWRITLITTDETLTPKLYSHNHLLDSELFVKSQ